MCRVWFCLVGPKNTSEATWDAPEAAFKMMVARSPNKCHSQFYEYSRGRKDCIFYHTSLSMSMRTSDDLEDAANKILAKIFNVKGSA